MHSWMSISLNRNAETLIKSVICTDLLYTIVNEQGKPTITGYEISDTNNNSFSDKRGIKVWKRQNKCEDIETNNLQ